MAEREKPLKKSQSGQKNHDLSMAGEVHYFSPLAAEGLLRRFKEIVRGNQVTLKDTKPVPLKTKS